MVADGTKELLRRLMVVIMLATKEVVWRFDNCGASRTQVGMMFVDFVALIMEGEPFVD